MEDDFYLKGNMNLCENLEVAFLHVHRESIQKADLCVKQGVDCDSTF